MTQYEILRSCAERRDAEQYAQALSSGGLRPLVVDTAQAEALGIRLEDSFGVLIEADRRAEADALLEKAPTPSGEADRLLRRVLLGIWLIVLVGAAPVFFLYVGWPLGPVAWVGLTLLTVLGDVVFFGLIFRRLWRERSLSDRRPS